MTLTPLFKPPVNHLYSSSLPIPTWLRQVTPLNFHRALKPTKSFGVIGTIYTFLYKLVGFQGSTSAYQICPWGSIWTPTALPITELGVIWTIDITPIYILTYLNTVIVITIQGENLLNVLVYYVFQTSVAAAVRFSRGNSDSRNFPIISFVQFHYVIYGMFLRLCVVSLHPLDLLCLLYLRNHQWSRSILNPHFHEKNLISLGWAVSDALQIKKYLKSNQFAAND